MKWKLPRFRPIDVALIMIIISLVGCIITFSILIRSCTKEVERVGLKNIVNEIWEGKK